MRLVATDIDGTISSRLIGGISARTVAALAACRAAGVPVVFVTGRPVRWMSGVIETTGHDGIALCANGAVLWDARRNEATAAASIDVEAVRSVAAELRAALPGQDLGFAVETLDGFRHDENYFRSTYVRETEGAAGAHSQGQLVAPVDGLDGLTGHGRPIIKMLVSSTTLTSDELLAVARTSVADHVAPTHSSPNAGIIELGPLGMTKGRALAALADRMGIAAADVVAFGDMPNDIEMLTWAGRGYAMADAHPETLAATEFVAPSVTEDGVAQILESLLSGTMGRGPGGLDV